MNKERNIYQLLAEKKVHERLDEEAVPYRVLGGIAAHAILNASEIHWRDRTIEISKEARLPALRDNNTLRDIDVLVVSPDTEKINKGKELLVHQCEGELAVSVFGLRRWTRAKKRLVPNMDFVSHRSIDEEGNFYIHLDDIETPLTRDWYDTWEVRRPQDDSPLFQTLSPMAIEAGYRMRSITGVRPKDKYKLEKFKEKLDLDSHLFDEHLTDLMLGAYTAQRMVGEAHASAIEEKRLKPWTWFWAKASTLSYLERQSRLVEWAQGGLEPILAPIVGRK